MSRILFFVFLAFLVWLAVRVLGGARKRRDVADAAEAAPPDRRVETIRQCAWCGVHVPVGDALALPDGRLYCCPAHREAARPEAGSDPRDGA
jgi:uncharacterized protein